ncbi:hypothetical protein BT93_L5707 [Corymbia citriodora subsp. variegata]|uniref:Major facilitator superfamily (MFS) profile domain-containing protein n=1 Tax=Corymbia citriodora subsp. variegata TaxID=360336 RepID=A0A8T0CF29_CORYI|nr:hypothetical protein BT93_L5707 [Corymbia citriodora subsp. variegata]
MLEHTRKRSLNGNDEKIMVESGKIFHEENADILKEEAEFVLSEDPKIEQRILRKCDKHILPWLFGIWLCAFIDRSNIGNARIDGLTTDLHLDGDKFNVALVVFYVPYILIDVPSNLVIKHFKAGYYLPSLIICWGLVSTFMGLTKSYTGLLVCRCLLGLFEGGLLPGIIVYLAMWYPRHEMSWRIGLFYCAAPLSGAFGGLLATGLSRIVVDSYKRWPWIFFIEGLITVIYGIVTLFFMPHNPGHAKFLSAEEKIVTMSVLKEDSRGATMEANVDAEKFSWHWVRMALLSPNLWFTSIAWFFVLVPLYSFSLFLPTIIKSLGFTATNAQLLTVPPNFAAFLLVLLTTYYSDRLKVRGPIMVAGCTLAIIGYAMLLGVKHHAATKYGGTFFVACGVYICSPMVMAWLANNTAPHYVRATALGMEVAIANCAAFVATFSYLTKDA